MPFALLGAVVIGLSLGLLGSGGSILTVPVLVYLLDQPDKVAIAGSLAIVGGISLIAAFPYALRRQVDWRSVLLFGLPGMAGSVLGAWLARFVAGPVQMLLFALVMLLAAAFMFRTPATRAGPARQPWWAVGLEGTAVGVVTGLVGVGGGFLIVPALVLLGGLPLRLAIGSSLVIIALKSAAGFAEYLQVLAAIDLQLDWSVIAWFVAIGAGGSFLGRHLAGRIRPVLLQRSFASVLVLVAGLILWQNAPVSAAETVRQEVQRMDLIGQQEPVVPLDPDDGQDHPLLPYPDGPQGGVALAGLDVAAHSYADAHAGEDGAANGGRPAHFEDASGPGAAGVERGPDALEHDRGG